RSPGPASPGPASPGPASPGPPAARNRVDPPAGGPPTRDSREPGHRRRDVDAPGSPRGLRGHGTRTGRGRHTGLGSPGSEAWERRRAGVARRVVELLLDPDQLV